MTDTDPPAPEGQMYCFASPPATDAEIGATPPRPACTLTRMHTQDGSGRPG